SSVVVFAWWAVIPNRVPAWWIVPTLGAVAVLAVAAVVVVPRWQLRAASKRHGIGTTEEAQKWVELENELRRTLVQVLGGIVVLVGAYVTWQEFQTTKQNLQATQQFNSNQVELTKKGQFTDRFTRAIDQLGKSGKENLAI